MRLLRQAAELVVSVAVIVVFAGLLRLPDPDDSAFEDLGLAQEQTA